MPVYLMALKVCPGAVDAVIKVMLGLILSSVLNLGYASVFSDTLKN